MTTQIYQRCILRQAHHGPHLFADAADNSIAMIGYCVAGRYRECTHKDDDFERCRCDDDANECTCGRTDPHEHDEGHERWLELSPMLN